MVLTNHLIYLVNVKTTRIFFSNNVCFSKSLNSTRKNQFKCHNLVFWLNNIPHNVGLLTNQWAAQINLVYKLVYASLFFFSFPHEPHENPNLCIIFLPGRTWVRVARCHSWGRLCGQIAKVILHRGLFDIVLTDRPRHSVASATWCRTVGQRHFGPRKYKACHNDPKLRILFGNCWVKPRYFSNLYCL